jgi:single-strand DNA-binding protein
MNLVILKGRLGKDPETRTGDNYNMANFTLATNDYGDKTNWHSCVAFSKTAELIAKHLKKGSEVLIEGRIEYKEKDGKWYTSIVVNKFEFIGSKNPTQGEGERAKQPHMTQAAKTPIGADVEDTSLPF